MSEKQQYPASQEQPEEEAMQRSQETLQSAFEFPLNLGVNLQKAAAELARSGMQMAAWAQSRNMDMTEETLEGYIRLLEQTSRGTEEMTRRGVETLERTARTGQQGVQSAENRLQARRQSRPGGRQSPQPQQYTQASQPRVQSQPRQQPQQRPQAHQQPQQRPEAHQQPQQLHGGGAQQIQEPQPAQQYQGPMAQRPQFQQFESRSRQQYQQPGEPQPHQPQPEPPQEESPVERAGTQGRSEGQESSPEPPSQ